MGLGGGEFEGEGFGVRREKGFRRRQRSLGI